MAATDTLQNNKGGKTLNATAPRKEEGMDPALKLKYLQYANPEEFGDVEASLDSYSDTRVENYQPENFATIAKPLPEVKIIEFKSPFKPQGTIDDFNSKLGLGPTIEVKPSQPINEGPVDLGALRIIQEGAKFIKIENVTQKATEVASAVGRGFSETSDAIGDLLKNDIFMKEKPAPKTKPESKPEQPKAENIAVQTAQAQQTSQEIFQISQERKRLPSIKDLREQVNDALGMASTFRGSVDEKTGEIRKDLQTLYEQAQADRATAKARQVSLATKSQTLAGGPAAANLGDERAGGGHWKSAVG